MYQEARAVTDLRGTAPNDWHGQFSRSFEALPEGGELVLVMHRDPKPLLYQLQSERAGAFDWSALEEGPEIWRIRVEKHGHEDPKGKSVTAYLEWDHDRLDGLLMFCCDRVAHGQKQEARRVFEEFRTGLRRHIRMEEQVLFPEFERATGQFEGGPTAVMRDEHRRIERILERMMSCLTDASPAEPWAGVHRELLTVLGHHNAKEERVVYPLTDRFLPAADREALIRRMQAV